MKGLIFTLAALSAYLVSGWNPSITFSKLIYKKDIRTCGSKNPGFTNFRRCFGDKFAWYVFVLDLFKAAAVVAVFAFLLSKYGVDHQFAAAFTGVFAVLGHAYPIWYGFKGEKGFLVSLSVIFVIDWRVGLIATLIMVVLLLTTKYMSLSTVTALLASPVIMILFDTALPVVEITTLTVIFVAIRHKENFKRLKNGTESKFCLKAR